MLHNVDSLTQLALQLAENLHSTPKSIQKVAAQTSEEASRWAFTQWALREKAREKFGRAKEMLFTREALEQTSREEVARYHASLFPKEVLVADLTCGIGGDLVALALRGKAVGFEIDPERASYARHNLSVYGVASEVREIDCLEADWDFEYAFADPARRAGGRRVFSPEQFVPNPWVLAEKMRSLRLGVMKLTPMLQDSVLKELGRSVEFLSFSGECLEALVMLGQESMQKPYTAVHVESGERISEGGEIIGIERPLEYLFEVDAAAIRAHALGTLCEKFGLRALGDSRGYLTSRELVRSVWLRPYRVLWEGAFRKEKVKDMLQQMGAAELVVKTRGPRLDPSSLVREFSKFLPKKGKEVVLCMYNVDSAVKVALCER
jgi:SAM-dependent methyltransferase